MILSNKKMHSVLKLIAAITICEIIGIISSILTQFQHLLWFNSIIKPSWNPPAYLFGPVWTLLYLLMGISLWLIWESTVEKEQKRNSILLFSIQLFLNFMWSIIFFKWQSPAFAFVDILLMILFITLTIKSFYKISPVSASILLPYLLWVCFAAFLNYTIWNLNK